MRKIGQFALDFLKNEDGPTAVEYAVMLALIIVVCIAAISAWAPMPARPSTRSAPPSAAPAAKRPDFCGQRPIVRRRPGDKPRSQSYRGLSPLWS